MSGPQANPTDWQPKRFRQRIDQGDVIESPNGEFVLWADYERLREALLCPRLTSDAPTEQFEAVLRDHDKGQPVNAQDLINALMWRLNNQRREIARLNSRIESARRDMRGNYE